MKHLLISFTLLSLVLASLQAQPKRIRVPQDQPTIQAGINAAVNGDTVLVAEGGYTENVKINKKIIMGSLFIVDGDTSHISKTIINGGGATNPDSGSTITLGSATDTTLLITGFTIRGGKGNKQYDSLGFVYWLGGGGIESTVGGGAHIVRNIITGNNLVTTGTVDSVYGGGIGISAPPSLAYTRYVIIERNTISGNTVNAVTVESGGIGLYLMSARIVGNIIENNVVAASTGYSYGGGVVLGSTSAVLYGNLIRGNSSTGQAGGIAVNGYGTYPGSLVMHNNIVTGNYAPTGGGLRVGTLTTVDLVNNTFANNTGSIGTGVSAGNQAGILIRALNHIFSNSNASVQISPRAASANFVNNLIFGQAFGTNSINADPKFVVGDPLYRLADNSPCIGAGPMSATVGGITVSAPTSDYLGLARPRPASTNPDIGALENDRSTGVEDVSEGIPTGFELEQNFPNPFNPSTTIRFELPVKSKVRLHIFNLLGQQVAELANEEVNAGYCQKVWNAGVASGLYFYRLEAVSVSDLSKRFVDVKKMILLK